MRSAEVLYVLRYWPTVSETFVAGEIAELERQGVRVCVVSMGKRADAALASNPPPSEVLDLPRGSALLRPWLRRPARSKLAARIGWAVAEARRRGVRRVHAHFAGEAAVFAQRIAGQLAVPWSVTVHAADLFKPIPGIRALLAAARPCITICEHHRRWIARHYGVDAQVVRCGVTLDRPQASPGVQPARVVCVARDVPKKDLDRLRRALPGQVDFIGAGALVPSTQVAARVARAQLFALPCCVASDGDRDGVPVAMMEAMAAGLPVVTRPIAGIPELVDQTVGWIAEDFEAALHEALMSPEQREFRGAAARARIAAGWSLEQSVVRLRSVWDRLRE